MKACSRVFVRFLPRGKSDNKEHAGVCSFFIYLFILHTLSTEQRFPLFTFASTKPRCESDNQAHRSLPRFFPACYLIAKLILAPVQSARPCSIKNGGTGRLDAGQTQRSQVIKNLKTSSSPPLRATHAMPNGLPMGSMTFGNGATPAG